MLDRLRVVMAQTCEQLGGELLELNGERDHVHLMLAMPPKTALSNVVTKLKGKSAYVLRREFSRARRQTSG